jgi:uncharacterized protein YegP (UPF0339 family)
VTADPGWRLERYRNPLARRSQRWRWRIRSTNGRTIAQSSEGYANHADLQRSIDLLWPDGAPE